MISVSVMQVLISVSLCVTLKIILFSKITEY